MSVTNSGSHWSLSTAPALIEGSTQALHLDSTLQDLSRHSFQIELDKLGIELARVFEQYPLLPGAILIQQGDVYGMISRRRFLEYLLRPHGFELFLKESLRVLYSYARSDVLILPGNTLILSAAQQALRRSAEFQNEPIVVQIDPQTYHLLDSDALNIAHWQIRGVETQVRYERAQAQMIQSDKMANLGRLVDGIAHEILDPVSFIWGNLSHVADYGASLLKLLEAYENALPEPPIALRHLYQDLEIDYLREDLSRTIVSIQTGAERLSKLAISLQNFCHIDTVYPKPADLHELLDGILLLLKSRLSSEIQVIKHYGRLPPVPCFAGQLNQVFMNILSNAVDVLLDQAVSQQFEDPTVSQRRSKPTIEVTTQVRSLSDHSGKTTRWVSICIANNGPGLPPQAKQQILESFSIKKRALKETSLAVSYQIITAKHGGKFEVRSSMCDESLSCETYTIDTGTEFEILLPLL